jgi:hypothetical protein
MPKEQLVASRPLLKALVKLVKLPSEGFTQILIVSSHRRLSRIRENRDSSLTQLKKLRLGAKIDGVGGLGACQNVESTFILHPFPSIPAFLV